MQPIITPASHQRVALAGGGGQDDSRLLDEVFAAWLSPGRRLLYWPIALRAIRPFASCFEWVSSTFAPLGVTRITMWTDLIGHQSGELDAFDGVYIGGGNTYSLLAELHASGFDRSLPAYVRRGHPVYGGSAGAAVLGRDIGTVAHIDHNDVGLADTHGLDLAEGFAVWVHYKPQDDERIDAYVRKTGQSVLAISERSGIVIEGAAMRSVGFEPAYRFDLLSQTPTRSPMGT